MLVLLTGMKTIKCDVWLTLIAKDSPISCFSKSSSRRARASGLLSDDHLEILTGGIWGESKTTEGPGVRMGVKAVLILI